MENLKLLRKVKKISSRREIQIARHLEANAIYFEHEFLNTTSENFFNYLSDELILKIFKWIPRSTLLKYGTVCKRWNRLVYDECLWRYYDLSNKIVKADVLVKLLNMNVKVFALGQSDIRKSTKKFLNQATIGSNQITIASQIESQLTNNLKLEFLDLTNTTIDTDSLNAIIKHCFSLKKLSLESLKINNDTLNFISQNKNLDTLNLCMVEGIKVDGLIMILSSLTKLKNLNISWTNMDRECVVLLCKHLSKSLQSLNLSGCRTTLLDSDIKNLVMSCPNLAELDLSDCQSLTSASVEMIANNLKNMKHLSFSRCYSIMPSSYLLLNRLNKLVALDLFNILKEKSIETLKSYIPSLTHVNRFVYSGIARPKAQSNNGKIWNYYETELIDID